MVTMSMELPYLILSLHHKDTRKNLINVYRVTADNLEKVNANAFLVKSIGMEGLLIKFISNKFFLGLVLYVAGGQDVIVNLFEKAQILDPALPPERTERRQVRMPAARDAFDIKMNTTSLVYCKYETDEQGRDIKLLMKKNFWMNNKIV